MAIYFFNREQAAQYEALRDLMAVGSFAIEDYAEPFDRLVRSSFLTDLVRETIADVDGLKDRLESSSGNGDWRLLLTDHFSLNVRTIGRNPQADMLAPFAASAPRHVSALPNNVLMGVKGSGTLRTNLFRSAFERDPEVFRRDHRVELIGERTLRDGDQLLLRASEDVLDFVEVIGEVATIELALINAHRLVWNYDAATGQAAFATSGSVDATRMEFALDLFRLFGDTGALPNLARVAREHTHHWIRWKAVKIMLQLDLESGLAALEGALQDAHAHVRNAARATFVNLRNANLAPKEQAHV
jgi:hypothetical protein